MTNDYINNEAVSIKTFELSAEIRATRAEIAELQALSDPTESETERLRDLVDLLPRLCRKYDDEVRPGRKRK